LVNLDYLDRAKIVTITRDLTFEFSLSVLYFLSGPKPQKISQTDPKLVAKQFRHNKTENHFSPYPRSEGDINLYTRLKIAIAGKACKKLPAYGRKKACNPAGLRPVIKTVIFLQGCRARLLSKAAGQGCRSRLPG
jgi:hypothetical protein